MRKTAYFAAVVLYLSCSLNGLGQSISGVVNSYYEVDGINTSLNSVTVQNSGGLAPGMKVLIIQMKGATINSTNTASFGNLTALNDAGNYEFNIICEVNGNDVVLRRQLLRTYNHTTGSVQLVTVPEYNVVTLTGTVQASPWNSASGTGGVVVFDADTIHLNNNVINASGRGFAGAAQVSYPTPTYDCSWAITVNAYYLPYPSSTYQTGGKKGEGIADYIANAEYARGKQATGGGGGNNHNAGGAGGGNYGTGGLGGSRQASGFNCTGNYPGIGGLSLSSSGYSAGNNRIFMGGGGGGGHENNAVGTGGGNGGGIVIISAAVISGTGSILANGDRPYDPTNADPYSADADGGGGGGAGGTIIINALEVLNTVTASATGARGSDASRNVASDCSGPGGGGGGGVIWTNINLPNITSVVTGGENGVASLGSSCPGSANGATAGTNGTSITGYIAPMNATNVCTPLAIGEINSFHALRDGSYARITWDMNIVDEVMSYDIQKSIDKVRYSTVASRSNDGRIAFEAYDKPAEKGLIYYRLKVSFLDGTVKYSTVAGVRFDSNSAQHFRLYPNPANEKVILDFNSNPSPSVVSIYSIVGEKIADYSLGNQQRTLQISTRNFKAGVYWIVADGHREKLIVAH